MLLQGAEPTGIAAGSCWPRAAPAYTLLYSRSWWCWIGDDFAVTESTLLVWLGIGSLVSPRYANEMNGRSTILVWVFQSDRRVSNVRLLHCCTLVAKGVQILDAVTYRSKYDRDPGTTVPSEPLSMILPFTGPIHSPVAATHTNAAIHASQRFGISHHCALSLVCRARKDSC